MNKHIFRSIMLFFLVAAFSACVKDNYDGPNAQFTGAIRDSLDGTLVEQDLQNGSTLEVVELGYESQVSQFWLIKNSGEFTNNLVFANKYDVYLRNGNFFPYSVPALEIKPGMNQHDFAVVPYIRVKNCNITYDKVANTIKASFNLEPGKSSVKLKQIRLYAFSDIYVGAYVTFNPSGGSDRQAFSPSASIDPQQTYSLTIDLNTNGSIFKTGRDYFFRVGALADVSGVGTIRTNYAPNKMITL